MDKSRGDNIQGIWDVIGPFWAKWRLGRVPMSWSFFCVVIQRTFRQLPNGRFSPNLIKKCSLVSRRWIRKDIFKNFHFRGHLPPKSEIENQSNRHLTQSRLQVMRCTAERYCLLLVVVQGPGSFQGPVNFSLRRMPWLWSYGASKLPNFRILAYFLHTKPLKRTFRWPAYSPGATSENDSMWWSKIQRMPSGTGDFLRLLVGELGTPKLAKFSPMANDYIHTECNCTARQVWTKDVWKRAILWTDVLSHQISSPVPPKSVQTQFWGTFQCKTYYTDSSP